MPRKFLLATCLLMSTCFVSADIPLYKPSSSSPSPIDISSNEYGGHSVAPDALGIGELAPDFSLALSDGVQFVLSEEAKEGPVVIIFYRGHW